MFDSALFFEIEWKHKNRRSGRESYLKRHEVREQIGLHDGTRGLVENLPCGEIRLGRRPFLWKSGRHRRKIKKLIFHSSGFFFGGRVRKFKRRPLHCRGPVQGVISASDILAKIFENRDLPEICFHDFQVNGSRFPNRDHGRDRDPFTWKSRNIDFHVK